MPYGKTAIPQNHGGAHEYDPRSASYYAISKNMKKRVAAKQFKGVPPIKHSRGSKSGTPQDSKAAAQLPKSIRPRAGISQRGGKNGYPGSMRPPMSGGMKRNPGGGMEYSKRSSMKGSGYSASDLYPQESGTPKTNKRRAAGGKYKSFQQIVRETVRGRRPARRTSFQATSVDPKSRPKSERPPMRRS